MRDYFEYIGIITLLGVMKTLPHRTRIRLAGFLTSRVLFPVLGWKKRIQTHLAFAMPEMPADARARLAPRIANNLGRLFMELFSPRSTGRVAAQTPFGGPGVAALDLALAQGQPVICVSGHFGNYDVVRAALVQRGFNVGGLYRLMNNRRFNARYEKSIAAVGGHIFPRDRGGFASMIKHLRGGGLLALLIDQHMDRGSRLSFFGQPAYTSVQAAQMALKYGAILVPIYAIRQPDGVSFIIEAEAPVPESDEDTMTQALNDSLEAQIRAHPEQWLWTHRRWKEARVSTS